jgi:hypothetical protein
MTNGQAKDNTRKIYRHPPCLLGRLATPQPRLLPFARPPSVTKTHARTRMVRSLEPEAMRSPASPTNATHLTLAVCPASVKRSVDGSVCGA